MGEKMGGRGACEGWPSTFRHVSRWRSPEPTGNDSGSKEASPCQSHQFPVRVGGMGGGALITAI